MRVGRDGFSSRLVARREFVERFRDRSFIISTAVTLVILVGVIVAAGLLDRPPSFHLGVVGDGSREPARLAARAAVTQGAVIRLHDVSDLVEGEDSLRTGDLDAILVDGARVVVRSQAPEQLLLLLQAAVQLEGVRSALLGAGLDAEGIASLLDRRLRVEALEPAAPSAAEDRTVTFVVVLLLYGQLFGYGVWVATGVVEEKASRVVELLLSAIRPRQLLLGKILGLGALGLLQLLVIGTVGLVTAQVAGVLRVPTDALSAIGLALLWFVLGFAFYSSVFAGAGSLVSRQEELQNALLPLQLIVLASFVISLEALQSPSSTLARVASLLPPTAPLAMPPRLVQDAAGLPEALASVAISLATTAALVPAAARIYAGAVLRIGPRVRLREAWRADRRGVEA